MSEALDMEPVMDLGLLVPSVSDNPSLHSIERSGYLHVSLKDTSDITDKHKEGDKVKRDRRKQRKDGRRSRGELGKSPSRGQVVGGRSPHHSKSTLTRRAGLGTDYAMATSAPRPIPGGASSVLAGLEDPYRPPHRLGRVDSDGNLQDQALVGTWAGGELYIGSPETGENMSRSFLRSGAPWDRSRMDQEAGTKEKHRRDTLWEEEEDEEDDQESETDEFLTPRMDVGGQSVSGSGSAFPTPLPSRRSGPSSSTTTQEDEPQGSWISGQTPRVSLLSQSLRRTAGLSEGPHIPSPVRDTSCRPNEAPEGAEKSVPFSLPVGWSNAPGMPSPITEYPAEQGDPSNGFPLNEEALERRLAQEEEEEEGALECSEEGDVSFSAPSSLLYSSRNPSPGPEERRVSSRVASTLPSPITPASTISSSSSPSSSPSLSSSLSHYPSLLTSAQGRWKAGWRLLWEGDVVRATRVLEPLADAHPQAALTLAECHLVRFLCTGDPADREEVMRRAGDTEALVDKILSSTSTLEEALSSWHGEGDGETDVDREYYRARCQVIRGDALLLNGILECVKGQSEIKGAFALRKAWKTYGRVASQVVPQVYFGLGICSYALTILPVTFQPILKAIGVEADRERGLEMIWDMYDAGGTRGK